VTSHKEGAVAEGKRSYTYIFLGLEECDSGNATKASPNVERKHLSYGPYVSFSLPGLHLIRTGHPAAER